MLRLGSTSSGSMRAVWKRGTFIRLTTAGSTANVAVSRGLYSP